MYARIDYFTSEAGTVVPGPDAPGLQGSTSLHQLSGPAAAVLTLWDSRPSAASYPEAPGHAARIYDVAGIRAGRAADEQPSHAALLHFDGPQSPEQVAAAEVAGDQRIWPAIANLPGLVGVCVLRDSLGSLVMHFGTSMTALETVGRTVMSTSLLPGEDAALLPGPDRIEFHRVNTFALPLHSESAASV